MAAPVYGLSGMVGCISVSGPLARFTSDDVARMERPLLKEARELSSDLGGASYWHLLPEVPPSPA